ncbi:11173_t:CDS:2 [Diversispora eburnea]|uniref:11173_t:CDS:1 n=1 Tax=Diversispora eburnea TaxID=1213867 RepID=A0A9N9FYF7_9GLOM|nr:11173_t:CDS:2 [Diversispora eburnea]
MKVPPNNKPYVKKSTQSQNKSLSESSAQIRASLGSTQNSGFSSSYPLKSYFTPHIIHLWLKNLESIVHLNESSNKKLNSDFISWKWVIHHPEEENNSKILNNNSKCLISQYNMLLEIEKDLMKFDESLALLWDKNVISPHRHPSYKVYNSIDSETLPYLRFTYENLINCKVKSPDSDFNYGCDCEDNCQTKKCSCAKDNDGGYPIQNGRLIRTDVGAIYECNSNCKCNKNCSYRIIQNGGKNNGLFEIFKTPNKGWGLRTLVPIRKGSFVLEHVGEILEPRTAKLREVCYEKLDMMAYFDLDFGFDENEKLKVLCVDSNYWCGASRFLNHSCDPNLITIPFFVEHKDPRFQRLAFFAKKNITTLTELTFDYKISSVKFECSCGSNICRYNKNTGRINT